MKSTHHVTQLYLIQRFPSIISRTLSSDECPGNSNMATSYGDKWLLWEGGLGTTYTPLTPQFTNLWIQPLIPAGPS